MTAWLYKNWCETATCNKATVNSFFLVLSANNCQMSTWKSHSDFPAEKLHKHIYRIQRCSLSLGFWHFQIGLDWNHLIQQNVDASLNSSRHVVICSAQNPWLNEQHCTLERCWKTDIKDKISCQHWNNTREHITTVAELLIVNEHWHLCCAVQQLCILSSLHRDTGV